MVGDDPEDYIYLKASAPTDDYGPDHAESLMFSALKRGLNKRDINGRRSIDYVPGNVKTISIRNLIEQYGSRFPDNADAAYVFPDVTVDTAPDGEQYADGYLALLANGTYGLTIPKLTEIADEIEGEVRDAFNDAYGDQTVAAVPYSTIPSSIRLDTPWGEIH